MDSAAARPRVARAEMIVHVSGAKYISLPMGLQMELVMQLDRRAGADVFFCMLTRGESQHYSSPCERFYKEKGTDMGGWNFQVSTDLTNEFMIPWAGGILRKSKEGGFLFVEDLQDTRVMWCPPT